MTVTTSRNPLAIRDFRLLWAGEAVSALGDQFALIALPWLALVLTGSALALGSVLALMAVPRALFMLVGGAVVDRWSPRRVMLASNAVRLVAVGGLGLIVVSGAAQLWMLYAFALVFGVADAFFFPAQTSMVPELVEPEQLQAANGIVQGTAQGTVLIGPALAGIAIAALGSGDAGAATTAGIGVALLLDAASFLVSLVTLWCIRPRAHATEAPASMAESIREGFRFVFSSKPLRAVLGISLGTNLLIVGPFEVGLPVIAYSRLPEGSAAFGILLSAFGGGSLIGLALGSILPAPRPSRFALAVLGSSSVAAVGLVGLTVAGSTIAAAVVIGIAGVALGYGNLLGITWIQGRIPPQLMGRVMSVLMLASMGLVPVSMVVAGVVVQFSLDGMLIVSGVGMALVCLGALLFPTIRNLGLEPPYVAPEPGGDAPEAGPAAPASTAPGTEPAGA